MVAATVVVTQALDTLVVTTRALDMAKCTAEVEDSTQALGMVRCMVEVADTTRALVILVATIRALVTARCMEEAADTTLDIPTPEAAAEARCTVAHALYQFLHLYQLPFPPLYQSLLQLLSAVILLLLAILLLSLLMTMTVIERSKHTMTPATMITATRRMTGITRGTGLLRLAAL